MPAAGNFSWQPLQCHWELWHGAAQVGCAPIRGWSVECCAFGVSTFRSKAGPLTVMVPSAPMLVLTLALTVGILQYRPPTRLPALSACHRVSFD